MNETLKNLMAERARRADELAALTRVIEILGGDAPERAPVRRERGAAPLDVRKGAVVAALADGPLTLPQLMKRIGEKESATRHALATLIEKGEVLKSAARSGKGAAYLYAVPEKLYRHGKAAESLLFADVKMDSKSPAEPG